MRTIVLAVVLAAAFGGGCSKSEPDHHEARSFYYWRTTFELSNVETQALADLHVSRLYVRLFDVAWSDGHAAPLGPLTKKSELPAGVEAVPVVFIKNEVMQHDTAGVAQQVWADIQRLALAPPKEIQIDCDWTDKTKGTYFAFLEELAKVSGVPLSATIRLHQVKYRERTGVPPVSRGTLMFYNMGKFSADPDARSIFDANAAEQYVARVGQYPLPLDVALPIWSWVVHVRDGAVVGLMQSTDPSELDQIDWIKRLDDGTYSATQSTFLHGEFLREGDTLKVEVTGPDETLAAAKLIDGHLSDGPRTITLFDLSERNLTRHDTASLDRVYREVR